MNTRPSSSAPTVDPNLPDPSTSPTSASEQGNDAPTDLLDLILAASQLEQSGQVQEAIDLYQQIIAADPQGFYGMSAQRALDALHTTLQPSEPLPASAATPVLTKPKPRLLRYWGNLSFATKLMILLVSGALVPVLIVTQGLVSISQSNAEREFQENLQSDAIAWEEEYIAWIRDESRSEAENLSRLVQTQAIDLSNPQQVAQQQAYLRSLVRLATSAQDNIHPEMTKSFRILTNASGVSVAQSVKIQADAAQGLSFSPLRPPDRPITTAEFQPIEGAPGITLNQLPIVQQALQLRQPLRGVELVPGEILRQLGLEQQATVPTADDTLQRSSSQTQPAAKGTYDLDNDRMGLVSMAVYPIQIGQRVVGAAVVGALLNRNSTILDYYAQISRVPVVSAYAYDWRVNTNIPALDGKNRALGVFAPQPVSKAVLQNEQVFVWKDKVAGENYLSVYRPLYDYRHERDPATKPIGMIAVSRPQTDLERLLLTQQLVALAIAGGGLLIIILLAIPVARTFARSLKNLSQFAQTVGAGNTDSRLETTDQQDEIGILTRQLNEMAASIDANLNAVRQQEQLRREEAEQQRQQKERLQQGVVNLLLEIEGAKRGDLTVDAPVTDGAIGSVADAFNATIRSLRQLVLDMQGVANNVNDLALGSVPEVQALSNEAQRQMEEISKTENTVTQINTSIQEVAKSAQEAATIAQIGASTAQAGELAMELTVASIDNIQAAVNKTANNVDRLTESFSMISEILTVINTISERTNLLAYNASIEASRAGENGQGFRVIAEEVRRLAQQATDATKTIELIVEAIRQEVIEVKQAMETGTLEVQTGTEQVNTTRQTLQSLVDITEQIDRYLQSISQTTTRQAKASQQVNQMMIEVAQISEQTATKSQGVAQSLQDLVTVARSLKTSVSQFRLEK